MNSDGVFGSGSKPSANLMAISQELTADKYISDEEDVSISCARKLSFSSPDRPQRNTLVSSKNFMCSSWVFGSAFSFGPRIDRASRAAEARQNHLGC